MTWRTESEQSIQNVQISNVQTETTRCRMHIQKTSDRRLSILNLTVHEQQWRNDEWNKDDYRERKKSKDRQDGGCKYHSSKIKQTKKSKQTMVVKHCRAFQISVAHQKDLRSTRPPTHTIKNQTDRIENKDASLQKSEQREAAWTLSVEWIGFFTLPSFIV